MLTQSIIIIHRMKFGVLIILSFIFNANLVFAQEANEAHTLELDSSVSTEPMEVTAQSLRILGKGVQDRRTGSILALACVGAPVASTEPNCNRLRFVEFVPEQGARYVGATFKVNHADNLEIGASEVKDLIQIRIKERRKAKRQAWFKKNSINIRDGFEFAGNTVMLPVIWAAILASFFDLQVLATVGVIVGAGVLTIPIICVTVSGLILLATSPSVLKTDHFDSAIINTDGWNWSIESRKVRHKRYLKTISQF